MANPPANFADWYVMAPLKLPAIGEGVDDDVDTFLAAWDEFGPGGTPGTFAEIGWAAIMNFAAAVEDAGVTDPTSENIKQALMDFTGPAIFGNEEISCPGPEDMPTICSPGAVFYQISDGWLTPAE